MFKIFGILLLTTMAAARFHSLHDPEFEPHFAFYHPDHGQSLIDRILQMRQRLRFLRETGLPATHLDSPHQGHASMPLTHPAAHACHIVELVFLLIAGVVRKLFSLQADRRRSRHSCTSASAGVRLEQLQARVL